MGTEGTRITFLLARLSIGLLVGRVDGGRSQKAWPPYLVLAALYPSSSISVGNVRVSEAHSRSFTYPAHGQEEHSNAYGDN